MYLFMRRIMQKYRYLTLVLLFLLGTYIGYQSGNNQGSRNQTNEKSLHHLNITIDNNVNQAVKINQAPSVDHNSRSKIDKGVPSSGGRCKSCYKWRFPIRIEPRKDLCKNSNGSSKSIDLVVLSNTRHTNYEHRAVQRKANQCPEGGKHNVRLIFIFGDDSSGDQKREKQLLAESQTYGDILQVAAYDGYYNMTILGHNAYQWLLDNCQGMKFVVKISDDNILNIPAILALLDKYGESQLHDVVFGHCWRGGAHIVRKANAKWYTSFKAYPYQRFPSYCSGSAFIMSQATTREVLEQSENIAYPTPMDDVNIGIAQRLTGHCVCHISGFHQALSRPVGKMVSSNTSVSQACSTVKTMSPFFGVHLHDFTPKLLEQFWNYHECFSQIVNIHVQCPRKNTCPENIYPVQ